MITYRFTKKERLRHKKKITLLFTTGKTLKLSLLKLYYLPSNQPQHQVLFTIPKRLVKKATLRNTIKRKIKEAYRLNKHTLAPSKQKFLLAYLYTHPHLQKPTYADLLVNIQQSINYLKKKSSK